MAASLVSFFAAATSAAVANWGEGGDWEGFVAAAFALAAAAEVAAFAFAPAPGAPGAPPLVSTARFGLASTVPAAVGILNVGACSFTSSTVLFSPRALPSNESGTPVCLGTREASGVPVPVIAAATAGSILEEMEGSSMGAAVEVFAREEEAGAAAAAAAAVAVVVAAAGTAVVVAAVVVASSARRSSASAGRGGARGAGAGRERRGHRQRQK